MADVREPLLGNGNGENIELQTAEPSRTDRSHARDTNCVLDCVKRRPVNIDELKTLVKSPGANVNFYNNADKKTALHWAVLNKEADVVDVLLEAGAEIIQDVDGNTALHYAVLSGPFVAFDIFKRLLPPRQIIESNCGDGLKFFKTSRGLPYTRKKTDYYIYMATSVNNEGFNVLDLALEDLTYEKRKIVEYIVRETDLDCLLRLLRNNTKGNFSSPFRLLIEEMPEIAKEVMDKCITTRKNEITFHYELLDDTYFLREWPPDFDDPLEYHLLKDREYEEYTDSIKKMKSNHPLKLMINGYRRTDTANNGIYHQLLSHPLVKALVRRKWNHTGIKFHVLNLALYLIYLAVLTVCVCTTVPPYITSQSPNNPFTYRNTTVCQNITLCQKETSCQNGNTCRNTTKCHNTTTCLDKSTTEAAVTTITCHSFETNRKPMIVDMQYFVIVLSLIMILKEVYQVRMYGCEYFKQKINYVELAVYISSVLFVVNVTECENTGYRTLWQWVFGTFSVFMAWIILLEFAKTFDRFGIYVIILWPIVKMFLLAVFPVVAVVLMAFAIAFTCVHQDQVEFENLWYSILKTTTMMISGSDFEEFQSLVENYNLAFVSYITYSLFQFLLTVLVINLMVSVAVENVKEMYKDASYVNIILQIEYTLEFEGMILFISSKLRDICKIRKFRKWFILNPNEKIELTQFVSTRLPVQQIIDLIDKNKQDSILERMNQIEMKMTKILNTVETKQCRCDGATLNTIKKKE